MAFINSIQSSGNAIAAQTNKLINGDFNKVNVAIWQSIQAISPYEVEITNPDASTTVFSGIGFNTVPTDNSGTAAEAGALTITNYSDCVDFVVRLICKANLKADGAAATAKASYFVLPRGTSQAFTSTDDKDGLIIRLDAVPTDYFQPGSDYPSATDGTSDDAALIWADAVANPITIPEDNQFLGTTFVD